MNDFDSKKKFNTNATEYSWIPEIFAIILKSVFSI